MGSLDLSIKPCPSQTKSVCSNVYGSQFAARPMPAQKLPDHEMPKEVAYQLIKDDLALDGQPMLKYVSMDISWVSRTSLTWF